VSALRVWAPEAERVEASIEGVRRPLARAAGGWWELRPAPAPGTEYLFHVDGDETGRPDPRSAHQPHGVHGPSRVVDHAAFRWTDGGWSAPPLAEALLYEVHVGTFSPAGTFDGVAEKLDHLLALGVTHVQLMPVNGFPGARNWGYDGVNLFAPHPAYGGPDGLKRLVDACHARGVAVLLDVVYNHLGPEGNYLERFGPYFTERYRTPWGKAVNLDRAGCDEVRRFFCDNALTWMRDYHLDGLRIDAIHAILDTSARHLLEQLAEETDALERELGRRLVLVAESDLNDPRVIRPRAEGGFGIDAQWSDDLHHALHGLLTGEKNGYYADFGELAHVAKALENAFVYDGVYSAYRRRTHGRRPDGLPGDRFLAYLQTHDQVGNRARGERLGHLIGPERQSTAAAVVFASPFVPMLFQGEEWAASAPFLYFTDHGDAELGRAVREGRRREFAAFGWKPEDVPDPQALDTFERSRLDWTEREREPHRSVEAWYRELARLRRETPELRDGRRELVRAAFDEDARWLRIERGPITVACNFGEGARRIGLEADRPADLLLASARGVEVAASEVVVPAGAVAILGRRR